MDELKALQGLGLELPSPAYMAGAILFGLLGWAAFRHGRKQGRRLTLWLGVALMLYPYLVSQTWALYAVGVGLCAAIALDRG
jgi:hypothetical protein